MTFPNKAAKYAAVVTTMPVVFRGLDSEKVEIWEECGNGYRKAVLSWSDKLLKYVKLNQKGHLTFCRYFSNKVLW